MEEKRKRGRPRTNPIKEIIKQAIEKEDQEMIAEIKKDLPSVEFEWDYISSMTPDFFDKTKSYEIIGYKPITKTQSLDFDPSWFTVARDTYTETGKYCSYVPFSKLWNDFWAAEYEKCTEGLTVNGYRVTGNHYFFLNYYQLPEVETSKAGTSRSDIFPKFLVYQYEYFHYYDLCTILRKNAVLMKSRGIGFSEINAALATRLYSVFHKSNIVITAQNDTYLTKTLQKVWGNLTFLNDNTQMGFFKLRQVLDTAKAKRASFYKIINGQKVESGFMSQITGIVADDDSKIRGDRTDLLIFEEAGHNPNLRKSFVKGEALVHLGGSKFGIISCGGTGGDKGPQMAGLIDMYYNPKTYDILPFKHSYTQDGEEILSGFFIPAFTALFVGDFIDNRGYCDEDRAKEYYQAIRDSKLSSPEALIDYCAEYCFNAEEAFALEGTNKFNKVLLSDQITQIRVHKQGPTIERGELQFTYKQNSGALKDKYDNITGVRWIPDNRGLINIIEHPLWEIKDNSESGDSHSYREMHNLYVAGIDSIDMGAAQTSDSTKDPSKFAIVIKRRAFGMSEPKYVAYYMFRPDNERTAYRTAMQMLMYYNCRANIEATRISMLTWARDKGFYHFFMPRPRATYPDPNRASGRRPIGTPGTAYIINHQTTLIANFVEDFAHTIWFPELLDQLIRYTDENKGKFDLIAAMGMAELADEELNGVVPVEKEIMSSEWQEMGWYTDEHGYKRFGIKPKSFSTRAYISTDMGYQNITSDPRYR